MLAERQLSEQALRGSYGHATVFGAHGCRGGSITGGQGLKLSLGTLARPWLKRGERACHAEHRTCALHRYWISYHLCSGLGAVGCSSWPWTKVIISDPVFQHQESRSLVLSVAQHSRNQMECLVTQKECLSMVHRSSTKWGWGERWSLLKSKVAKKITEYGWGGIAKLYLMWYRIKVRDTQITSILEYYNLHESVLHKE